MADNSEKHIKILSDSGEVSGVSSNKSAHRWGINYREDDPSFDFQLNYVKFNWTQKILEPHIHKDSTEIVYMLHGIQYYTVDNKDYRVLGGQLLITPPGTVHSSRREPEQKGDFYYLTINPNCLASLLPEDQEAVRALRILLSEKVVVRSIPDINQFRTLMEELRHAHGNSGSCRKCHVLCAILRLLLYTWETVEPDNYIVQYSDFMGQIYLYIEDHITEKLRVDDIARVSQYSKTALQQKFKTYSHLTVHDYILSRKIEAAKRFMNEEGVNPHEVWKKLSFSSQSYFAQVFRQFTGMTITQYLNRRGNESQIIE